MSSCQSNKNGWEYCEQAHDHHEKYDHYEKKEVCCCKESMKKALELLSHPMLKSHVLFNEFAFIGKNYLVGTNLEEYPLTGSQTDNINIPSAQFKGLDHCNCDLIKINNANVYYPIPNNDPSQVLLNGFDTSHYISLCSIESIAFDYNAGITTCEFEKLLSKLLDDSDKKCMVKCQDCCCNNGIFNEIFNPTSPNNLISLTGGWLAVKNATVLGKIGSVLVLSSTTRNRIFFICLNSVGIIGY